MAVNSKEYWRKREEENLKKNLKTEEEYIKTINGYYDYMMDQIQKEMCSIGIGTDIDQEKMLEWKVKKARIQDMAIMSVIAFGGFVSSILLTSKMRIQQFNKINKTIMIAAMVTNAFVGIIVGWLIFTFVRMWMI